jgi:hypothetical protein
MRTPDQVPLIDIELSDQWFSAPSEKDRIVITGMWTALRGDTAADLLRLGDRPANEDPTALRYDLHQMRGYLASYGFARCAAVLKQWEMDPNTVPLAASYSRDAMQAYQEGIAAMLARYPWLAKL